MPKAMNSQQARELTDIPNIGRSMAEDLRGLGIETPAQVRSMDPVTVYEQLRGPMGERHDPCVLDTFLAAHDFMNGGTARPWWDFTARRKALLARQR
ncbi:helix-hairpin-helix domain-containing protein [Hylemonella sp. W303a]|uniref:helix-hairpin-helix domain-containing protein n=1 Tax=Hylemonella sp. W303a TaxID=3389873 RepID=UPI00396B4256